MKSDRLTARIASFAFGVLSLTAGAWPAAALGHASDLIEAASTSNIDRSLQRPSSMAGTRSAE